MTSGVVDLSPFDFFDRLATIIPPPRKQWHGYQGVLATNHPPRLVVTAMTIGKVGRDRETANRTYSINEKPCSHDTSRIAWAKLLDKVGEAFPRACLNCGGDVRLISYITQPETIRKILEHVGEPLEPSHISPP